MEGKILETGKAEKGIIHRFKKGTKVKIIEIHKYHYLCENKKGEQFIVQKDQIEIL